MSTAILSQTASMPTTVGIGDDDLYEVIDGQRVRTPPMGIFAVWTAFRLARFLANFAEENIGQAITEGLFHLPAPINRDPALLRATSHYRGRKSLRRRVPWGWARIMAPVSRPAHSRGRRQPN